MKDGAEIRVDAVIPAKAGIWWPTALDPRFRGDDISGKYRILILNRYGPAARKAMAGLLLVFALFLSPGHAQAQALGFPNAPAGSQVVADCDFNDGSKTCGGKLKTYYPGGGVVNMPNAPYSPGGVYYNALRNGSANGDGSQLTFMGSPNMKDMYVGFYWKMNAEFAGYMHGGNKLFFMRGSSGSAPGCSTNGLFGITGNENSASYTLTFATNTSGYTRGGPYSNETNPTCSNWSGGEICYPNAGSVPLLRDTWYLIEAYVKASSCPTCQDGIVRWWVNGTLVGDVTNFNYGCGVVNEFVFDHTWDGQLAAQCRQTTGDPRSRDCNRDWYHYLDHLHITAPDCPGGCPVTGNTGGNSNSCPAGTSPGGGGGTTPPVVQPGSRWPNEPATATVVADCAFNDGDKTCGGVLQIFYQGGGFVNMPNAPYSPSGVYYNALRNGSSTGDGTQMTFTGSRNMKDMYVGFYWKMSKDFQGYANGTNKLFFMRDFGNPVANCNTNGIFVVGGTDGIDGRNWPWTIFWGTNSGGYSPGQPFSNENNPSCSNWTGGYMCYPNVTTPKLYPDTWYLIEAYVKASSCQTCKDGIIRWWVDGVLAGDVTNYNYGCGVVNEFVFDHTWDGQGAAQCVSASNPYGRDCSRDWYHYLDHLRIDAPDCPGGCPVTGNTGTPNTGGNGCIPDPEVDIDQIIVTWQCPNVKVTWDCPVDPRVVCAGAGPQGSTEDSLAAWDNAVKGRWVPNIFCMTHQFSVNMMNQVEAVGMMLDARQQLDTQQLMQKLAAEAHKDYQPSAQMCRIGTNVRSLAASEDMGRTSAQVLSTAMMSRETLSANGSSFAGAYGDKSARFEQFARTYCDPADVNGALASICGVTNPADRNKDINYPATIENSLTIALNTPKGMADVMALSKNLFANDVFGRVPERITQMEYAKDELQDMRSVHAMRGVAFDSFARIAGMRAAGSAQAGPFMDNILVDLGLTAPEAKEFLGANPSYFAQMEVLTKKMFQSPAFFTNLYDKPENVGRTGVAIQALKLMHDRDRYESALRREMLISLILELKLRAAQDAVNNNILNNLNTTFRD